MSNSDTTGGLDLSTPNGKIALFLFCVGLLVYFVPFIVARSRAVNNVPQIFVLNLFLGWTLIGWVLALIWALKPVEKRVSIVPTQSTSLLTDISLNNQCAKGKHTAPPFGKICTQCGAKL